MLYGQASVKDKPEQVTKAEALLAIIRQQGRNIGRGSYMGASSAIRAILESFDKPENAAIVAELGLSQAVVNLHTSQAGFEAAFWCCRQAAKTRSGGHVAHAKPGATTRSHTEWDGHPSEDHLLAARGTTTMTADPLGIDLPGIVNPPGSAKKAPIFFPSIL
jgi:hypothetical protein